jgi:hypothetical protein
MQRVKIDRQRFAGAFTAAAILVGALAGVVQSSTGAGWVENLWARITHRHTVAERVDQYGVDVAARLAPRFAAAGVPYPPAELALVAFKDAHRLELYARTKPDDTWRSIRSYPVLALSGRLGPKLREGDRQVPEGVYAVESLNPNSLFHLAIRVGYPNAEDQDAALADGRTRLGSDIMIHGAAASIGCLAMGDRAAEELFVLTALAGPKNVRIIISPVDFRVPGTTAPTTDVQWIQERYRKLATELAQFPRTP